MAGGGVLTLEGGLQDGGRRLSLVGAREGARLVDLLEGVWLFNWGNV